MNRPEDERSSDVPPFDRRVLLYIPIVLIALILDLAIGGLGR